MMFKYALSAIFAVTIPLVSAVKTSSENLLIRLSNFIFSSALLPLKEFDLANKYYNQILLEKNDDFQSLWGLVLCEAGCSNNEELKNSGYNFPETRNYIRAYRAATPKNQDRLNDLCNEWSELKNRQKFKPLIDTIMKKLGVSCEIDIIKSPQLLSTLPEFTELMQANNEYIVSKYRFLETLQKQYNELETEIKQKLEAIKRL